MDILKNSKITLKKSFEFPCSYIDGNLERRLYIDLKKSKNENLLINELTLNGFRRNHDHMYIPICKKCSLCISSRINIKKFSFSKSNKRNIKTNDNFILTKQLKNKSLERFNLFKEYCVIRHSNGQMKNMNISEFENFFYKSSNNKIVFDLVDKNKKILGSILLDVLDNGYSAVYSFFNPSKNYKGLGINIILKTIKFLKKERIAHLYLGYWVKESAKMNYKNKFNSLELFLDGKWLPNNTINF